MYVSVVVKTSPPTRRLDLKREFDAYTRAPIAASPFIRSLWDTVGSPGDPEADGPTSCLVLEWMDTTLQELSSSEHKQNSALFKAVFEGGLSALVPFKDEKIVHTGTTY